MARPLTVRPRKGVGVEGGGLVKQSRLPAPLETISTSTTSPDRRSSSPTHPALLSASSPSAATQMRKTTTNKTIGQCCLAHLQVSVCCYCESLLSFLCNMNFPNNHITKGCSLRSSRIKTAKNMEHICFKLAGWRCVSWHFEANFLSC